MSENLLKKIIKNKKRKLLEIKKSTNLNLLNEIISKKSIYVDFKKKIEDNLSNQKFSIIAEIKKS